MDLVRENIIAKRMEQLEEIYDEGPDAALRKLEGTRPGLKANTVHIRARGQTLDETPTESSTSFSPDAMPSGLIHLLSHLAPDCSQLADISHLLDEAEQRADEREERLQQMFIKACLGRVSLITPGFESTIEHISVFMGSRHLLAVVLPMWIDMDSGRL
jgi:hypothetical protein